MALRPRPASIGTLPALAARLPAAAPVAAVPAATGPPAGAAFHVGKPAAGKYRQHTAPG
ncbi:hypothetical protein [Hymenobacter canadensis]|uniref:Uncharacterized protein n=1 Tax=Hymenobacter canadensis TaxID=2999067 RepID=A0ABY7LLZ7_9BACT|nr:hypothetical protein [Hymenobacter canadensis]WBA41478.1 hypothetical protein O3303_16885 [Hymenobacter canadensis]